MVYAAFLDHVMSEWEEEHRGKGKPKPRTAKKKVKKKAKKYLRPDPPEPPQLVGHPLGGDLAIPSYEHPPLLLPSNHDDRNPRTPAADTRCPGGPHRRYHGRDLPDPVGAHGQPSGRLAMVFRDRLLGRLLDDHRRRSGSLLRGVPGDCHHPVGERVVRVSLGPVARDAVGTS